MAGKRVSVLGSAALITLITACGPFAEAHQGHHHLSPEPNAVPSPQPEHERNARAIQLDYQNRVAPIFEKACMDCHSSRTQYPWYSKIPGIKQMIASDIEEARSHLDFSNGFPFMSHASLVEDLDAIAKSIKDGSMPPFSYRIMHSGTALSAEEKEHVLDWVARSKPLLNP